MYDRLSKQVLRRRPRTDESNGLGRRKPIAKAEKRGTESCRRRTIKGAASPKQPSRIRVYSCLACDSQVLYQVMLKAQSQAPSCDKSSRVNMSYWQKLQAASSKPQAASLKLQATSRKLPDPWTTVHGYWKSFRCPRSEGIYNDKCVVWMFHMERNLMWRKF